MSIKLVDTLESMGNFPVANADGIQFTDGESLQKKLDDGTLGSGNVGASYIELSQEEYDALSDEEKVNGSEYRTYDTGHIYKLGVEFGKETDISSKQDNLSQVKFTMRRNSVSEGRYCLIGSSDLSQNLLMCEPYRFQGIFGDGTTSVENKSIIDFMVSFREGVGNPDEVLSGFANSSKGFEFVDLLITTDETTNMAYAYVDFKTSGSVATGEITKPVLEAESYMDFAESFELTDTYIGTLVCKMSDYAKIITNIDDVNDPSETSVWSSKKTSDKIAKVDSALDELENITRLTDFDEAIPEKGKNKIYYVNKLIDTYKCAHWRVESMYYDVSGAKQYRGVQKATSINGVDNIMLMREYYLDDNNVMRWSAWTELATMNKVNALHKETTGFITGSLLGSVVKDANLYYQKFGDNRLVINGWVSVDAVPTRTPIFTLPNNWKANSNYLLPCYVIDTNVACACLIDIDKGTVNSYTPLPATLELRFCGEIYLM